jgi:hypothetical protein
MELEIDTKEKQGMMVLHVALCTKEKTKHSQTKKQHKFNCDNEFVRER